MKPIASYSLVGLGAGVVLGLLLHAKPASAHILLTSPVPRTTDLKDGPCGGVGAANKRGTKVTTFKPGETITVKWTETIEHPGHFRISFDDNGQSKFVDPKSFTDLNTAPSVLIDNIKDKTTLNATYSQEITLPDVECTNCTLQVIQVMTDKPPYGDGNDLYYQCADIVLSNGAGAEEEDAGDASSSSSSSGTATPAPADTGGCATSSSSPSLPGSAALLGVVTIGAIGAFTRRRRSHPSRSPKRGSPNRPPSRAK